MKKFDKLSAAFVATTIVLFMGGLYVSCSIDDNADFGEAQLETLAESSMTRTGESVNHTEAPNPSVIYEAIDTTIEVYINSIVDAHIRISTSEGYNVVTNPHATISIEQHGYDYFTETKYYIKDKYLLSGTVYAEYVVILLETDDSRYDEYLQTYSGTVSAALHIKKQTTSGGSTEEEKKDSTSTDKRH